MDSVRETDVKCITWHENDETLYRNMLKLLKQH